jgi:hypothetical protein
MKFIDLYNQSKDKRDFKYRQRVFKMYCYLMKNNPREFKIEWDDLVGYFRYYQRINAYFEGEFLTTKWEQKDDSNGKYKTMGDYAR